MGVTVDDHIDTAGFFQKVNGTVGDGFIINTKVGDADNNVCACFFKSCYLFVCAGIKFFSCKEFKTFDECRVGFGLCFGSFKSEETNFYSVFFYDGVTVIDGSIVFKDVCTKNFEICVFEVCFKLCPSVVKLVVTENSDVITGDIHHGYSICAFMKAYVNGTLAVVAGVNENDFCTGCFVFINECSYFCVIFNFTMNVIGVKNYSFAGVVSFNSKYSFADVVSFSKCGDSHCENEHCCEDEA